MWWDAGSGMGVLHHAIYHFDDEVLRRSKLHLVWNGKGDFSGLHHSR
jgi:hypothetical protein